MGIGINIVVYLMLSRLFIELKGIEILIIKIDSMEFLKVLDWGGLESLRYLWYNYPCLIIARFMLKIN